MIPFLNECYDIKKVYNWVVQENLDSTPIFFDRCLYFYFVGKLANVPNEELKRLFNKYSKIIEKDNFYEFSEKFSLLKNKVLKELK